jgi:predicted O-linked N-acetylglucosamine transferase (SPINDLY family)
MGVPVVTLAGQTHVSRVGASLLTHLGASEWIANTPDEYLDIGHNLASNPPRLATIRGSLRERMRQSPLCDAPRFTRNLEAAFRTMWSHYCAGSRAALPGGSLQGRADGAQTRAEPSAQVSGPAVT